MTKTTIVAAVFVLTFWMFGTLLAEEYRVNNSAELGDAILIAVHGDVIVLDGPGPYDTGGFTFYQNITIMSPEGTRRMMTGDGFGVDGSSVSFSDADFQSNSTSGDGGAISVENGGTLNINGSAEFRNNTAGGFGGAIVLNGGYMVVNLENRGDCLLFEGNHDNGFVSNAIHITAGSQLYFNHAMGTDVYFKDNPITGDSGEIWLYNSGTVHIDNGHSAFMGNTYVIDGYWQLENNASYGVSATGFLGVDVSGALSGSGTLSGSSIEVYGSVLPGFYIDQGDYSYQPGTLTFTDPTTFRSGSRYMPTLWADGTGALIAETTPGLVTVEPGATIHLNFRPGDYSQGQQTYTTIASENFVVSKPGFIDATYSGTTGEITLNSLDTNYFSSQTGAGNLQPFASRFDAMLADPSTSDAWWDKLSAMSLAIENGENIGSMLNSLTGGQRANTIGLSLMTPKELAFRHIGHEPVSRYRHSTSLWFQPFFRHHAIHDSADASGFDVSQPGFFIGLDQRFTQRSYGGVFTSYSAPKLSAEDYKADTDVFTFGMLGGTRWDNGWDAKTWAVFGFENMRSSRSESGSDLFGGSIYGNAAPPLNLNGNAQNDLVDTDANYGKTNGWSLGVGIEAGRTWTQRLNRYCNLSLRPFVGLDYEQANQSGFTESGNDEFAIQYLGGSLHRGLVRTGISATTSAYAFDLTGRVMYSGLVFGDTAPKSKAVLPSLMADPFTVRGNDCGRHFVSTGFDATVWLNANRTRYLATTYEAWMGHRLTSHTLTLAFVQRF